MSILIVAEAFLRRSSPLGTVLGDSSRQSVFRPEPGRGHLGESPRGGGEFSAACNHTSMQGERKWCSLAKDPAPLLPPPWLLRAARDIDSCVLNPSALPFSKVHLEKRIYAAGVTCHLQGREGDSGSGKDWELPGLPGAGFTDPREAALAACFGKQSNPAVSQGALYKPDFGEIILRKQE